MLLMVVGLDGAVLTTAPLIMNAEETNAWKDIASALLDKVKTPKNSLQLLNQFSHQSDQLPPRRLEALPLTPLITSLLAILMIQMSANYIPNGTLRIMKLDIWIPSTLFSERMESANIGSLILAEMATLVPDKEPEHASNGAISLEDWASDLLLRFHKSKLNWCQPS